MRVELHERLANPVVVPATRVLITNDQGTPVCLCVEVVPGHNRVFRVGDADFNEQLRMHGINRTVIFTRAEVKRIAEGGG